MLLRCLARTLPLLILAVAGSAATTKQLRVQLTGDDCRKITAISLVMNGYDGSSHRIPLDPIPGKICQWTADAPSTFATARSYFSLRAGFARTECHQPAEEEVREFQPVAVLTFACCPSQPVRKLTIVTEPAMEVSYLRRIEVPKVRDATHSTPVPCTEHGWFDRGSGIVDHVFRDEKIQLQLGLQRPDPSLAGLGLDELQSEKSASVELTPDAVILRLMKQRPTFSPNALELDVIRLREIRFRKLTVKVE